MIISTDNTLNYKNGLDEIRNKNPCVIYPENNQVLNSHIVCVYVSI